MAEITKRGWEKHHRRYDDMGTWIGSLWQTTIKSGSHLIKIQKVLGEGIPTPAAELELHLFKIIWWCFRALYFLRGKQNDHNHDQ
jgi:hypothetical protein